MHELVRYDAMCRAIAEAHSIDEVKDIRDKALAIEMYAKQAKNTEAERRACEIRLRAERQAGKMLKDTERAKGGGGHLSRAVTGATARPSAPPPLADYGISRPQSSRWQKLAEVPDDEFEATFAGTKKPSTTGILAANGKAPKAKTREPVDDRALWLWGRLLDFEREGILEADPEALFKNMLDHMQGSVREMVPLVIAWLERLPL